MHFWRLKFTKSIIFRASKIAKTVFLELIHYPILISRKIWETENPRISHTVFSFEKRFGRSSFFYQKVDFTKHFFESEFHVLPHCALTSPLNFNWFFLEILRLPALWTLDNSCTQKSRFDALWSDQSLELKISNFLWFSSIS